MNQHERIARHMAEERQRAPQEQRNRQVAIAAQRASVAQLMEGPLPGGGLANVSRSDIVDREREGWSRLIVVERDGVQKVARRDAITTLYADGWHLVRQVITESDYPQPPAQP